MTPREVRKARELRADVGLPERFQIDSSLIDRLDGDGIRLEQQKRGVADEFKVTYANWHTEPGTPDMLPHALTEDTAIARNYRVAAVIALVAEMGVAAWMFWKRGMNPIVGALFALAITLIFERSIHFAIYGPTGQRRPKVALRRLKRVAFYPALGCFLFAVVTTLVARSIEGPLAADQRIIAIVTSGLFFLTLGLVFLAAALSTATFIYRWSARPANRYYALDAEWRASRAFMAEVRRDTPAPQAPAATAVNEVRSDDSVQPRSVASMPRSIPTSAAGALVLFVLTLGAAACTGHAAPGEVQESVTSHQALPACNTIIDTSGSVVNLGLVWSQVRRGLPDLVIREDCGVLRVFTFDVDGWNWKPVVEIAIPRTRPVDAAYVPAELDGAKNFKDAIEAKQRALAGVARRAHEELVIGLLRKLDIVDDCLKSVSSTAGSDPVGVLRRIARTPASNDLFVVVTDMADTGLGSYPSPLSAAPTGVRVLVLLAPANGRDAAHVGAPVASADQYENRVQLLRTIAPWASVGPYFATGYAGLLSPSRGGDAK